MPRRRLLDVRGQSGPWIDYLCERYPEWVESSNRASASEAWPRGSEPAAAPVFAHNRVLIDAPAETVFGELCEASSWPTYYENASRVRLPHRSERLQLGMAFRFRTFGVSFRARVVELEPTRRLAWECVGSFPRIRVYHRWSLMAQDTGTLVVTEETNVVDTLRWFPLVHRQLTELLRTSGVDRALHAAHQRWLTALKARIESRTND